MPETSFNTIGLIVRQQCDKHLAEIEQICRSLAKHGELLVHCIDQDQGLPGYASASLPQIGEQADLAVSIGGDGTLLSAARQLVDFGIPLVGINLGRLGFLADVTMQDLDRHLAGIFSGDYSVEQRFLLQGKTHMQGQAPQQYIALNDIILHSHQSISMIEFEVFSNHQLINKQRADGLIVATPTGSTAYALSGGGPIMHPSMDSIALVPICPHTLSNRPIVLPANQQIEIKLSRPEMAGLVSFDGRSQAVIEYGDCITIERYARQITLLHPADYDYFHILRAKLKWSNQP
jgi:NAD+ kinase